MEHCLGPLVGDVVVVGVELGDDLGQGELGVDPLLAGGLLLQVGEVEQVVLAVLGGEDKEVPEASCFEVLPTLRTSFLFSTSHNR